ncbi:hypothetical protein [Oharaeibacter diazotrophicus]|uniref:Uncharacterized protein n=1 Tax=Oharaeibacter diazotrophicus TaxID=1920512 RepID=A0A4R6R891_9HYPH|nr:hypothetical protein [Oharaeibacter diazotrophicus]TDP81985.1 hypothetical protein EDD54_4246 [Oharaeibacter diazotrophicus]BBE73617.1 hypothetical protein OHA_1_03231 [Pleomorphomonas sp. SM30]GLS75406.1 hypothetical protein GCM10007904_07410 [Oharaeibacter diazotrophicus]
MIAFVVRTLGLVLFAASFVALVADGVKSLSADAWTFTPLGATWGAASPGSLAAFTSVAKAATPAYLWEAVAAAFLAAPTFAVGGLCGVALLVAGAKRRRGR